MKTIKFQLEVLTCPSCINKIERVLNGEKGVHLAKVRFNSSRVHVDYDEQITSPERLASVIETIGYPVISY